MKPLSNHGQPSSVVNVARIPGLHELWAETLGNPLVCIAILDGPVDLSHPSFQGANLTEVETLVPNEAGDRPASQHGTHVASVVFGQHAGPVKGIAPRCRGLIAPIFTDVVSGSPVPCSQIDLARAILQVTQAGANIINVSGGQFSPSGSAHPILTDAIRYTARNGVLIVAAAGNQGCDCLHIPGALPSVLAVGAMDCEGEPLSFSNWGTVYQSQGLLAPGEGIEGAKPGGGTFRASGTSFATAIVSGVAALLLSLLIQRGQKVHATLIREALLRSSLGCDQQRTTDCRRLLAGRLNVQGAVSFLTPGVVSMADQTNENGSSLLAEGTGIGSSNVQDIAGSVQTSKLNPDAKTIIPAVVCEGTGNGVGQQAKLNNGQVASCAVPSGAGAAMVAPSACGCQSCTGGVGGPSGQLVYALGKIGYDFRTEARRDTIIANMNKPAGQLQGNPFAPRELVDYLTAEGNAAEAARITWTLNHDATPIYAIQPQGAFAREAYEILVGFLRDQIEKRVEERVEIVAIPGVIIGSTRLFTGQTVPVVAPVIRGMSSWNIDKLVESVLGPAAKEEGKRQEGAKDPGEALRDFLRRIYFEFRNLGVTAEERAMNFAGTQIFRLARSLERQHLRRYQLDTIEKPQRSPICRPDSDCWDVKIIFFNPENVLHARSAFVQTVDVSDVVPVMISDGIREFAVR